MLTSQSMGEVLTIRTRKGYRLTVYSIIVNLVIVAMAIAYTCILTLDLIAVEDDVNWFIPAIIHLTCINVIAIALTFDTIVLLYFQNFKSPMANTSFMLLLLCQILITVNALTNNYKERYIMILICALVSFVLLCMYIMFISAYYEDWKDTLKIKQEEKYLLIVTKSTAKSRITTCITIPLKGNLPNITTDSSYASVYSTLSTMDTADPNLPSTSQGRR